MDTYQFVRGRGGIVTIACLKRARRDWADFLRRADIVVRDGYVALGSAISDEQLLAVRHTAVITCVSAAVHHGIPLVAPPSSTHLAVPGSRTRLPAELRQPGIVVHRERAPIRTVPGRRWLADPLTTVNRILLCCDERQALVALDSALNRGLISRDEVRVPGRGPHHARIARAVGRADAGARSILESIVRMELLEAGITCEAAVCIDTVGEVDLVVDGRIVVEADGGTHGELAQWRMDRERDLRLFEKGYVVLRLTYQQVMDGRAVPVIRHLLAFLRDMPEPGRAEFRSRVTQWDPTVEAYGAADGYWVTEADGATEAYEDDAAALGWSW